MEAARELKVYHLEIGFQELGVRVGDLILYGELCIQQFILLFEDFFVLVVLIMLEIDFTVKPLAT